MTFVDTDLKDIKIIFDYYKKFMNNFSYLHEITQRSYNELCEQLQRTASETLKEESERREEFDALMRRLQDMYEDVEQRYTNILEKDYRDTLARWYDILSEYNAMHL